MKRSLKVLVFLAVLVLVVILYFVITAAVKKADEKAGGSTGEQRIELLDSGKLKSVTWEYDGDRNTFDVSGSTWILRGKTSFPLDTSFVDAMKEAVKNLYSVKWIDDVTDYSMYGLTDNVCTLIVETENGKTEFTVGGLNAATKKCYLTVSGDDTVYLVNESVRKAFSHTLLQIAEIEEIPKLSNVFGFILRIGDKSIAIESVEVQSAISTSGGTTSKWEVDLDGVIGGELQKDADEETVDHLRAGIEKFVSNIVWKECVDIELKKNEPELYGLDKPYCELELFYTEMGKISTGEYNEDGSAIMKEVEYRLSKTFSFGNKLEDCYYATASDTMRCYLVDQATVKYLLDLEKYIDLDKYLG